MMLGIQEYAAGAQLQRLEELASPWRIETGPSAWRLFARRLANVRWTQR